MTSVGKTRSNPVLLALFLFPESSSMAEPEKKSSGPLPVEVTNTQPLQVTVVAPEKDALLLDLDIARAQPKPNAEPAAQPQVTTTTTTTNAPPPLPVPVAKSENLTLPPNTTAADDLVTKGQRHINRVWEYSQSAIALMITLAVIYCAVNEITSQELSNGFFLIIGFYFSRQNHQNTGGVGPKPDASVQSR